MFASQPAMNAVLFHLRDLNTLGSYHWHNDIQLMQSPESPTALYIRQWFAFWLLAKDVLRLDNCSVWPDDRRSFHVKKGELPIESLVKMAFFTGSPLNQKRLKQWDLRGSTLKLNSMRDYNGFAIDRVLNVNAENVELSTLYDFAIITVPKPRGLIADRVKSFRMLHNDVTFDYIRKEVKLVSDPLCAMAHFVLACCPSLEKLNIEINFLFQVISFESYVRWIKQLTERLKNGTLVDLEMHGCELIIATRAKHKERKLTTAIQNGHNVTTMGERFSIKRTDGDVVISRQVELKKKCFVRHTLVGYS